MLYKGKVIGQRLEPQIGRDRGWLNHRRTGRDDRRVDAVVLGAFEMQPGERLALQRLQPQHHEARLAKIVDDATLISAGRLDADAPDAVGGQVFAQSLPADRVVVHRQWRRFLMDGDVKLVLAGIDAGGDRDSIAHLPRPCLARGTWSSGNHTGPMKKAGGITLRCSPQRLRVDRSSASQPGPGCRQDWALLSERIEINRNRYYKGGIPWGIPPVQIRWNCTLRQLFTSAPVPARLRSVAVTSTRPSAPITQP